jgi:hypothetical protein
MQCDDLASVEYAKDLASKETFAFFVALQKGGISDAEIDVIAKQIMDGTFGK